jgi:exodeoxyribonuclease-3
MRKSAVKLITWNVNGIRARENELLSLLADEKPDVLMLQETKATLEQLPATLYGLTAILDYHSIWHGSAGYSGVSVHLRKGVFERPKDAHPAFDYETRVVEAHTKLVSGGGAWVFVSMYLPNGGKDFDAKLKFMRALGAYPKALGDEGKTVVIAGDLNVARADIDVHRSQRKVGLIGQRPEERDLLEKFFAGLVDVGRARAPDDKQLFTWWPYWRNARERNVGWRIDYVLMNEPLATTVTDVRVRRDFGTSDHAPVIVAFG